MCICRPALRAPQLRNGTQSIAGISPPGGLSVNSNLPSPNSISLPRSKLSPYCRLRRCLMPQNEQQDRRVTQRFSGSIPCSFCCREGVYSGIAKNLSIDGAFVASDESPPQGSIGTLVFKSEGVVKLRDLAPHFRTSFRANLG